MTTIPDYGWISAAPSHSHSYLEPAILGFVANASNGPPIGAAKPKVFDAGCGNGALLCKLKSVGYEVAGCDVSESGIAIAQQALGNDARLECLSVYDDLAATFGRDWDVVIAAEVIEHLYSPRDLLKRVRGLLRPEGTLILTTPYHGYLKNIALAASGALDRHFTALWDGGHIKFWSYRTLTTLLQEAHFHNFRFAGAGRLPWIWKSMVVSSTRAG